MERLSAYEAAEQLFDLYGEDVYRYARIVLRSHSEAEDVTQDVFIKVLKSWPTFRNESSVKTWVWALARRCVADAVRMNKRQERKLLKVKQEAGIRGESGCDVGFSEVEDCLRSLTLPYRQVVSLRLIQGFTTRETADILGWSEAKVRSTLHRATVRLRDSLRDKEITTSQQSEMEV